MMPIPMISNKIQEYVYTGGMRVNNLTTRRYDSDGDLIWSVDHGDFLSAIAVDKDGNIYTGGSRTSVGPGTNITTRKYNSNGNLIWSVDHGFSIKTNGLAVDSDGNVYTVGGASTNNSVKKYDSDGNLIWSIGQFQEVFVITVDDDGNVYTGGGGSIRKLDTDSNTIFTIILTGTTCISIAIDKDRNIYAGIFDNDNGLTTRKYDSSGNLVWSLPTPPQGPSGVFFTPREIAVDIDDNIYLAFPRLFINGQFATLLKYDSSLNLIWTVDHGATTSHTTVAVDKNSNVYTGGIITNNITTRKYNSNGNLLWSLDNGANVRAIATFPPNKGAFLS